MSRTIRNFVNGESVDSVSGQTSDLVNPTTGEVFAQAVVSNAEDVDRAYRGRVRRVRVLEPDHARRSARRPC